MCTLGSRLNCCLFLASLLPLSAQETPLFRTETRLSTIGFHVGQKGFYVTNLKSADFELLEDGKPRPITFFENGATATVPVELILLFDRSGSVLDAGLLQPLVFQDRVIRELPNVNLSVYAFNSHLRRYAPPTRDDATLSAAFDAIKVGGQAAAPIPLALPPKRKTEKGGTWIYESVIAAAQDAAKGPASVSRMMLVISDGLSTTTSLPEDAASICQELGIPVHTVVLGHAKVLASLARSQPHANSKHPSASTGWLNAQSRENKVKDFLRLAVLTGGLPFDLPSITLDIVQKLLDGMVGEIRTEYVAGFVPEASNGAPRKHKIEIRLIDKNSGKLIGGTRTVIH